MAKRPVIITDSPIISAVDPAPDSPTPDIADSPIVKGDPSFGAKLAELTPKQRKLVSLLCLSGISRSEAYKQAYNTRKTGTPLAAAATQMCKRSKIASIVATFAESSWSGSISDGPEIRRVALSVMRDIALHGQAERVKLSAAVALGKTNIAGLYSGPSTLHQHLHIGDSSPRDVLLEKMQKLFGAPQVVDSTLLVSTNEVPIDGTARVDGILDAEVVEPEPADEPGPSDPESKAPPAGPGTPPCE